MVKTADLQPSRSGLLLEVALQAKGLVAFGEQLVIDRAVGVVAGGATFPHSFVLEDEWPPLGGVAAAAGIVELGERGAHASDGRTLVRIMAIAAAQFAFGDR